MRHEEAPTLQPAQLGIGRLFDRIRDAVVVVDVETERIVLWNPAATAIFGYRPEEMLGMPLVDLVPASHRDAHLAGIAHFRDTGRGRIIDAALPVEVPATRRDGAPLTVELSLSPLTNVDVPGNFVLAIIRDATERKQLEVTRAEQARLEGALLMLRTAEHELLNDLAAVSGSIQLLARDPGLPANLHEYACQARRRVHAAATTLRRLLRLTRLEETTWGPTLQPTIDLPRSSGHAATDALDQVRQPASFDDGGPDAQ